MARTTPFKLDATRPFYAAVGVADLTVELARTTATDVQHRIAKVDLEPQALREQARTRVEDLQADARALPGRVESLVGEYVTEAGEAYGDLATRGRSLVNRIRRQQATQDAKAAGRTTVAKAKTTKTQTAGAAKASANRATGTTRSAAKRTGATARRNTKATTTSAKKTASATRKAAGDAAQKVGD